jgi:hypothetical protein
MKLSFVDFDFTLRKQVETVQTGTYTEDGFAGPLIGMDMSFGPSEEFVMTVEASHVKGTALNVALTYLF